MLDYVAGLPAFLGYFAVGLAAYGVFAVIYTFLTPQKEVQLIRAGNLAAVTARHFSGALASAAASRVSSVDSSSWDYIYARWFLYCEFILRNLKGSLLISTGIWILVIGRQRRHGILTY
ncbi:DUF350 domain-containing protein [Rhizobium leguminosarum]|uniref:Uncharacterized protein n=1 Tax=Rhizobium leguminosarum TaxID=384 RepID=A0A1B1CHY1_RHILE|nr:DUF350 domain-containing protein [Rhizobium leguminosarum]ANP89373.1 hypothetical protein BA011_26810 [Rhizobium leguminosarum]